MSIARSEFLKRGNVISSCLIDAASIDGTPAEIEKNNRAALFRSGISINIFSSLELFVKERTHELLISHQKNGINFAQLDPKMQRALTIGAIQGLTFQCKILGDDPNAQAAKFISEINNIQQASGDLSKASRYSFCHQASNVTSGEINNILEAFGVLNGWHCINTLSKRIGMGGFLDFKTEHENIARRRHSCAHNPNAKIPTGDAVSSFDASLGIAIGFDILISTAILQRIAGAAFPQIGLDRKTIFRFLRPAKSTPDSYDELEEAKPSAAKLTLVKTHNTLYDAGAEAQANSINKKQTLVTLSPTGKPVSWDTFVN